MSTSTTPAPDAPAEEAAEITPGEGHEHPPDSLYIKIAIVLAVVTAAEVATYVVDFGVLKIPSLMVMMVAKFALVVLYFMHLRFDHKLLSWVFVAGIVVAAAVYIVTLTAFEFWMG